MRSYAEIETELVEYVRENKEEKKREEKKSKVKRGERN